MRIPSGNPNGIKTGYLWREVLARASVTDILENYAQVVEVRDEKTGRKKKTQIWAATQFTGRKQAPCSNRKRAQKLVP